MSHKLLTILMVVASLGYGCWFLISQSHDEGTQMMFRNNSDIDVIVTYQGESFVVAAGDSLPYTVHPNDGGWTFEPSN